tara:strand:- start:8379 stop:10175 length:1797 start_codon:yes stop_codon:yes gene_type:complete
MAVAGVSTYMSMKLNKNMANVQTLLNDTGTPIEKLKDGVKTLSVDLNKSTGDLSTGLYEVVSAFQHSNENLIQLQISAKAAKAGVAETADAVNMLSTAGKAYNMVAPEQLTHLSDLAFMTIKLGQTNFPDLAASMTEVSDMAARLKIPIDEVYGSFAAFTTGPGSSRIVATRFNAAMTAMLKPTKAMQVAMKKLGVTNAKAMIETYGFNGAIKALAATTDGSEESLTKLFENVRGAKYAMAVTGNRGERLAEIMADIANASGATETAFQRQMNGINATGERWGALTKRVLNFATTLGDALAPVMNKILDRLEPLIIKIESMSPAVLNTVIAVGALVAALGPLLIITSWLIKAFILVKGAIAGAGAATALLSNPVGWAIGGFLLLGAVVINLWNKLEPLRESLTALASTLYTTLAPVIAVVASVLTLVWKVVNLLVMILQPFIVLTAKLARIFIILNPIVWLLGKIFSVILIVINAVITAIEWVTDKIANLTGAIAGFFGVVKKGGEDTKKSLSDMGEVNIGMGDMPRLDDLGTMSAGIDMSAMGLNPTGGGGGFTLPTGSESKVIVDFRNVPTGTAIEKTSGQVELTADNGYIMQGAN